MIGSAGCAPALPCGAWCAGGADAVLNRTGGDVTPLSGVPSAAPRPTAVRTGAPPGRCARRRCASLRCPDPDGATPAGQQRRLASRPHRAQHLLAWRDGDERVTRAEPPRLVHREVQRRQVVPGLVGGAEVDRHAHEPVTAVVRRHRGLGRLCSPWTNVNRWACSARETNHSVPARLRCQAVTGRTRTLSVCRPSAVITRRRARPVVSPAGAPGRS